MKKSTLLVAGLLFAASLAYASETTTFSGNPTPYHNHGPVDYRDAEPIVFLERGIEFMVFPNGELDFNTEPSINNGGHSGSFYRRSVTNNTNRGTRVDHDSKGRVRRVGNVFINYDYAGRVKRIGNIYMDYGRYGLTQIGYLRLMYDNFGHITDAIGYINQANRYYVYEPCNHTYGNDGGYNNGGSHDGGYYRNGRPSKE
jgi:hypothetical protein